MKSRINTERLTLRHITEDDTTAIFDYCKNENVGPNAGWKPHENIEETRVVMKEMFLNNSMTYGIVLNETQQLIGTIGFVLDEHVENGDIYMLGYSLNEDFWGCGYATEAAKALLDFGFKHLKLNIITAYCYSFNKRSQRVLQKCGFVYQKLLPKVELRYDGRLLDCYFYKIMKALPAKRKLSLSHR
ncbi:MAG: GNAT family N-acetyltransferase [Muribaculaceae bacterium]|nr:GNAT family N-acetyltransferase [Muribaculaceae bacterium]